MWENQWNGAGIKKPSSFTPGQWRHEAIRINLGSEPMFTLKDPEAEAQNTAAWTETEGGKITYRLFLFSKI